MKWSDFSSAVMPYVIGCSDPLLEQHARIAAIEFCRRTLCFQRLLDESFSDGTPLVEIEMPADAQLVKIKSVQVRDRDWMLVDPIHGMELARADSMIDFCFTQDNKTLMVYPAQPNQTPVRVVAALMPTHTARGLDDAVASQFMYDIVPGIIASLMRVPGQPFSNPRDSMVHQGQFEARIRTVAGKVGRGHSAAKMRSHVTYV